MRRREGRRLSEREREGRRDREGRREQTAGKPNTQTKINKQTGKETPAHTPAQSQLFCNTTGYKSPEYVNNVD